MKVKNIQPKTKITFTTNAAKDLQKKAYKWWKAESEDMLGKQVIATAAYLKENQSYLVRQTSLYARMYGNTSLMGYAGASAANKMDNTTGLPAERPTYNLIQSVTDTIVSRLGQTKPAPVFLTNNGDYKQRKISQQLNNFTLGEFHQTKAYEKAVIALRDACVTGTGILKVYESPDHKVAIDRVLRTELLVDGNDGIYGEPRQIFQLKLVDRDVLMVVAPKYKSLIKSAETAFPDNSSTSTQTISDQVIVVESWHLPSGKDAKDGRHVIACSSGVLLDEPWTKDKFPFVFLSYAPRLLGFWAQGVAERLTGTQMEINSLLLTISRSTRLVGTPKVLVEEGSGIVSSSFNNDIGAVWKYRGTPPTIEVFSSNHPEMYAQLQRYIDYGFQQEGISLMQATSQKPAGLDSGEAIRSYDDISTDRFATVSKRFDNLFIDLAYLVVEEAKDICEKEGKYQTIYPNKDGTKQINFPEIDFLENPFVVQVFNQSSLPKDPAGRMQKVAEMIQAGMISIKEGRRLLDYPDLDQMEKLANASEERIYQTLDKIIDKGEYNPPDPFMDLALAQEITVQYYNLYVASKLEEEKAQMLRDFFTQVLTLQQAAQPPAPVQPGLPPQANPQPAPTSPLVPNSPNPPSATAA